MLLWNNKKKLLSLHNYVDTKNWLQLFLDTTFPHGPLKVFGSFIRGRVVGMLSKTRARVAELSARPYSYLPPVGL